MKFPILNWVQCILPIQKSELKKIIPLLLLKFLISAVYCILTCMKDTLLVTGEHTSAEVIPVIKGFIIFPLSILIVFIYVKLNNQIQPNTLFYSIVIFFLLLIAGYGFYFYPNSELLSPNTTANWLTTYFGGKYIHFIAVYRHWIHVVFFITAEMWGQIVMVLLYWSFVNNICKVQEAKQFYTLFIAAGNLAQLIIGPLILMHSQQYPNRHFTLMLQTLIGYAIISGIFIILIYWWFQRFIYKNTTLPKISKTKLSLWKSIQHICSSRYLLKITTMVVGCGFAMNITEITWKSYLKQVFPLPADYQVFMGKVFFATGLLALITSLFFSGNFLKRFGWNISAKIAPITMGVSGTIFFLISYFKAYLDPLTAFLGVDTLLFIAFFGAFQNILSKTVKYGFFDATKEIAYIPLDQESKIKGKAAIDVVGSRIGKSSSSWIHIVLISQTSTGSIQPFSGILLVILIIITIAWYHSTQFVYTKLENDDTKKTNI